MLPPCSEEDNGCGCKLQQMVLLTNNLHYSTGPEELPGQCNRTSVWKLVCFRQKRAFGIRLICNIVKQKSYKKLIMVKLYTKFLKQISSHIFSDLIDSMIVDVASESHRIARLGLDRNLEEEEEELRLSAQARADASNSSEANGKYVVDIFGQNHPTVATEVFECMNCGRSIAAGRFAPHLEKCMGKGRKARLKVTRSSTAANNRHSRGGRGASAHSPYSNSSNSSRLSNGTSGVAVEEHSNGINGDL